MSVSSRLCKVCQCRWPLGFVRCPRCDATTEIVVNQAPTRTKFHAYECIFERKYQRREEQRIADGFVAPEALGKREARQIIELERHLDEGEKVA